MSAALLVALSPLSLAVLGAAVGFHPAVRPLGWPARVAVSFAAGAVALTAEAVLLSALHVPWTVAALSLPLLCLSLLLALFWSRRPVRDPVARPYRPTPVLAAVAALVAASALWHLTASLATTRATSVDYVFFWGVKAARFAAARGIDQSLLARPDFVHAVPDYPPLVPVVGAWSALLTGRALWKASLLMSAIWLLAAVPILLAFLRQRLSDDTATALAAFWTVALAVSLASSYSGGSAEPPLLFFETAAGVALLTEGEGLRNSRFLPSLFLAGAALTKVEGTVGALLLIAGVVVRDRVEGRSRPLVRALPLLAAPASALLLWFGFQRATGLPVGYRGHGPLLAFHFGHVGSILRSMLLDLRAGCWWLSWILPLLALILLTRHRSAALPGLIAAGGLLLFFFFDYLHDLRDPWIRIGWTLPRVSQPALSLLILGTGVACGPPEATGRARDTLLGQEPVLEAGRGGSSRRIAGERKKGS